MQSFHLAPLLAILVVYIGILTFGIFISRRKDSTSSLSGMLLANRKLPFLLGVFSLTATWVGGGYINGTVEAVYQNGLVWAQAPWGYALSLIVGGALFAGVMRKRNYTTMLDPFTERYGHKITAALYIPALIGDIFWSAAILVGLGAAFSLILGVNYEQAVILSTIMAMAFAYWGGLWAVSYTDTIQFVLIVAGLCIVVPSAWPEGLTLNNVWDQYQQKFGELGHLVPPWQGWSGEGEWRFRVWSWVDSALLLIFGGIPWGVYFQRILATPNARVARNISFLAGFLCLSMAILPVLLGNIAAITNWNQWIADAPAGAMVFPYILQYLTSPVVAVVGLGIITAGVLASVDSSLLSISSMFVWNVYKPLMRRKGDEKHLQFVMKCAILGGGLTAMMLALSVKSVYVLWYLCSDLVYVILFPQLLLVLYGKQITKQGVLVGMLVGLMLRLGGGEPLLGIPAAIAYPMVDPDLGTQFPFRTFAMLCSLLTTWMVSRITTKQEVTPQEDDYPTEFQKAMD